MRKKYMLIGLGILIGVLLSTAAVVIAGSLDSSAPPASTSSFTLEDIYQRLANGTAGTQSTWAEPADGPDVPTGHTLNEVMAVAKPGALAPRVNKTGQTTSYATGDDGDHQMGIDPVIGPTGGATGAFNTPAWTGVRFTDNGDGTVTDNLTGLIWLQHANCNALAGTDANGKADWVTALSAANALADGTCGLSDSSSAGEWRLPNINELHSLIDLTRSGPALPSIHHFDGVQSGYYWSSTAVAGYSYFAWGVFLGDGVVNLDDKTYTYYVWPVRGGE